MREIRVLALSHLMVRLIRVRAPLYFLIFSFHAVAVAAPAGVVSDSESSSTAGHTDVEFRQNLSQMLQLTEKSIKVLGTQISESSNAPFLPDLYVQLGDLQSQKSNALYYIQMEIEKGAALKTDKNFSPVVLAQKEAIATYRIVLNDFPKYSKRGSVMYRVALAEKSIDEIPEFIRFTKQLLHEFPNSEEAIRCDILLGQYYFENGDYDESKQLFSLVVRTGFVYERNLARYRLGLIELAKDRFKEGLKYFEEVASDTELHEQDNPYQVSLKQKSTKSDLKREVLIESIIPYTSVYAVNADPVGYYAKLSPNEAVFQEVLQKLAVRYIQQKKYIAAMKLLRVISKRTADPQKTVNIYRDVLMMIPPAERINIPESELKYVLEKYTEWMASYQLPKPLLNKSYQFLEMQTRELGTTSHQLAKSTQDEVKKRFYLERSKEFYLLYLSYFNHTPNASNISTDLADVYYGLKDYLKCGDYYLRTFQGVYGVVKSKSLLVDNAILCLDNKFDASYYDNTRIHGLLIKSLTDYFAFDRSKASQPKLSLLLLKAEYEQGFFPETLNKLYQFIATFKGSKESLSAADLVLDYYNTRADYQALQEAASRLLSMHLENASPRFRNLLSLNESRSFNAKLTQIRDSSKSKFLKEQVRDIAGYSEFSQGKSYLQVALQSGSGALQNAVLKEALVKSKRERDFKTYLTVATVMSEKESNLTKRLEILNSIAYEQIRVTQFYGGLANLSKIYLNPSFSVKSRQTAFDDAVGVLLILRDFEGLLKLTRNPLWRSKSSSLSTRLKGSLQDLMESPTRVQPELAELLLQEAGDLDRESLLALYRGRYKLDSGMQTRISGQISRVCSDHGKHPVCLWQEFERLDRGSLKAFEDRLKGAPRSLPGVQAQAAGFEGLLNSLKGLQGSEDPNLEIGVLVRMTGLYQAFAHYLNETAQANPDLRQVLVQKAKETQEASQGFASQCQSMAKQATGFVPAGKFCSSSRPFQFQSFLEQRLETATSIHRADATDSAIDDKESELFGSASDAVGVQLSLAKLYLERNENAQAAATAAYGLSNYSASKPELSAVLGCSLLSLGFYSEAIFRLGSASEGDPLKARCMARLREILGEIKETR